MRILIPARKGSKGLPEKNRTLFQYTSDIIPKELASKTYVSTDDEILVEMANSYGFNVHNRSTELSQDDTSTKDVVVDFLRDKSSDLTVLLYLTYPERTWQDISRGLIELEKHESRSLLCSFETELTPYLMMFELPNGKGKQVIEHDLYRRQDYPKCFELSHFVCIFYDNEVPKLNKNLYNKDTHFMRCLKKVDVDLPSHLDRFKHGNKNNSGDRNQS